MNRETAEKYRRPNSGHTLRDLLPEKFQGLWDVLETPHAQAHDRVPWAPNQPGAESGGLRPCTEQRLTLKARGLGVSAPQRKARLPGLEKGEPNI